MGEIVYFVPGKRDRADGLLPEYFHAVPGTVAGAYVEACTQPGDLVVDPFCEGASVLREAVRAGRRAAGGSFNPLAVRLTRLVLSPPARRQLDAAVTRLGNAPRMGVPFGQHIEELYAVRCPRCGQATPADAFTWERDSRTILHSDWQCRHCGHQAAPPVLGEGEARGELAGGRGLHYWYVVDRIAPAGSPLRERAQQLLELYTPRNLYALSSLLMKIESLFAQDEMREALKLLLLSCLDTCSSLYGPDSPSPRRRLRLPAHFVERNVWRAFLAAAGEFPAAGEGSPFPLADSPSTLLTDEGSPRAVLLPFGVNRLVASLPPGCVALAMASPPRPEPAFWALSWMWAGWLFGHEVAAPLKPLLRQWRVDWDWYARMMQAAFRALRAVLTDDAPLVLILDGSEPAMVESLALALAGAGYAPGTWLQQGDTRAYRLTCRRSPSLPGPPAGAEGLAAALRAGTMDVVPGLIAARGEPATWDALRLPVYRRLAESGLLGQAAVAEDLPTPARTFVAGQAQEALAEAKALIGLEETREAKEEAAFSLPARWWLRHPAPAAPPLSTRVEAAVHQLFLSTLILTGEALAEEVYRRFPGDLTPDAGLIAVCRRSYGREVTPGHWQLRLEDQPERRDAEVAGIREALGELGERLGFEASLLAEPPHAPATGRFPSFDVLWRDEGRPAYAFAIQWTARVHDLLLAEVPAGVRPCLVMPGGRAELVAFKLERDPRLRRAVAGVGWQFVKYRHLRRILAEESLERHVLKQIFGLDPPIERDGAQMLLF